MSGGRIGIFVATMTGLAELCADEASDALAAQGIRAEVRLMDGLDAGAIDGLDVIVVVSSTYGQGDVPDNGQHFFDALQDSGTLADRRFAVFGLGDRTYADTFCNGGAQWDRLLEEKGATRLLPFERHDASAGTMAEDVAVEWAKRLAPLLAAAGGEIAATSDLPA
ncbi:MAG TPA: flavodoxin domain-containing protein [Hyphomicrobiales bacterium]|nr:flavodoxin domain-containing protein [Hyphomicrobiales bacterium]